MVVDGWVWGAGRIDLFLRFLVFQEQLELPIATKQEASRKLPAAGAAPGASSLVVKLSLGTPCTNSIGLSRRSVDNLSPHGWKRTAQIPRAGAGCCQVRLSPPPARWRKRVAVVANFRDYSPVA